ncbi:hypothetical protein J2X52_000067 [Luteimonas sp. 3794]|nr:hypothetical protein [Luteimonas sp. 3794]
MAYRMQTRVVSRVREVRRIEPFPAKRGRVGWGKRAGQGVMSLKSGGESLILGFSES